MILIYYLLGGLDSLCMARKSIVLVATLTVAIVNFFFNSDTAADAPLPTEEFYLFN